jgi:Secretion system C-terminal sorting domain
MKKIALVYLMLSLLLPVLHSQTCLPDGITFETQEEINDFQNDYPGCTEIEGNVQVEGDEINSLDGLSVLTSIGGRLRFYSCTALEDMSGLENLVSVGGDLEIYVWPGKTTALTSLSGLDNLSTVGGDLKFTGNDKLSDFSGLNKLNSVGGDMSIGGNLLLQSLAGLDTLASVGGDIWIGENPVLSSLSALGNLTSVVGAIEIYTNISLTSLAGLENIDVSDYDGYWIISYNEKLSDCAIESLCTYLALPESSVDAAFNASGCNSDTEIKAVCSVSVEKNSGSEQFSIYPLPAGDRVYYEGSLSTSVKAIYIYNQVGQVIDYYENVTNPMDVSSLSPGIYIMEFVTDGLPVREKLLIE